MKIKLDENLPPRLANRLKDLDHDVHTVHGKRLTGHATWFASGLPLAWISSCGPTGWA